MIILSILLAILKITGIILLWVLAVIAGLVLLVILLLLLALLSPIKYNVSLEHKNRLDYSINGRWLFSAVRFVFSKRENIFFASLKIFGRSILGEKTKKTKNSKKTTFKNKRVKINKEKLDDLINTVGEKISDGIKDEVSDELHDKNEETSSKAASGELNNKNEETKVKSKTVSYDDKTIKKDKRGKEKQQDNEKGTVLNKISNMYNTFQLIKDHPDRKKIEKAIKRYMKRVKRALAVKRFDCTALIGFSDPLYTGWLEAAMGAVCFVWCPYDTIKTDFTREVFELKLSLVGKIKLMSLLTATAKLAFYRPVWKLIKKTVFKKDKNKNKENDNYKKKG